METTPTIPTTPTSATRLFFMDHLRAGLILLVVIHHISLIYAAAYPFYYVEPTTAGVVIILLVFMQLFDQAYFMGLLFLISGYFTPASFDHKGAGKFLKDRLVRLGIPLMIFMFVFGPLSTFVGLSAMPYSLTGITIDYTFEQYLQWVNWGPFWFVALLLIFDVGYAAFRIALKNRRLQPEEGFSFPRYRTIALFILVLAFASYLIRINVTILTTVFLFPTFSYLPQYVSFFVIGTLAYHGDWFRKLSDKVAKRVFLVAIIVTPILFLFSIRGGAEYAGGGYWQSGTYALWDSTFAVGMSLFLIAFFRRHFNLQGKFGRFISQHSYTIYFIHIPTIVILAALVLGGITIYPLFKFILAVAIAIPLCFGVAFLVRKIPYANRVL